MVLSAFRLGSRIRIFLILFIFISLSMFPSFPTTGCDIGCFTKWSDQKFWGFGPVHYHDFRHPCHMIPSFQIQTTRKSRTFPQILSKYDSSQLDMSQHISLNHPNLKVSHLAKPTWYAHLQMDHNSHFHLSHSLGASLFQQKRVAHFFTVEYRTLPISLSYKVLGDSNVFQ